MSKETKQRQLVRAFALMTTISAYFTGPLLVGIFAGQWLEARYDGSGLYLVGGMLLGLATGIFGIYRVIRQFYGDGDDTE